MAIPKIKIEYLNGMLGTVSDTADGLFAIVAGATAVTGKFDLETPYTITRFDDVEDLGLTSENNAALYQYLKDFYAEADEGTKVVVYGVATTATKAALCDKDTGSVRKLIIAMNGKLKGIFIGNNDVAEPNQNSEGITDEEITAVSVAQTLAEWSTSSLYAPLFIVFAPNSVDYTATSFHDFTDSEYNRVAVMLGSTSANGDPAIGLLAGRLASIGVQRNCGRVKDGTLSPDKMYIGATLVENSDTLVSNLYDDGYITPRCYVGRSGYFFADDSLACDPTDDYAHISLRRTIDKAYRIAYDTLLDYMLDELEINEDGTLQVGVIKSWQAAVESAINRQMTAQGELSNTSDGGGCECYIDETQDVLSTSKVEVTVKVRPFGYARYINVSLGFAVTNS